MQVKEDLQAPEDLMVSLDLLVEMDPEDLMVEQERQEQPEQLVSSAQLEAEVRHRLHRSVTFECRSRKVRWEKEAQIVGIEVVCCVVTNHAAPPLRYPQGFTM